MIRGRAPIWLSEPSRYAGLARNTARTLLTMLGLLLIATMMMTLAAPAPPTIDPAPHNRADDRRDVLLYGKIIDDVRHGADYYAAAATALRVGGYPLRPFVTFRLPTLAIVQASLPAFLTSMLLHSLLLAVVIAWGQRWRATFARWPGLVVAVGLLVINLAVYRVHELIVFHEIWAGLLLALSLALWRPNAWVPTVAIATAAMLIRETSALYAVVMMGMAVSERRRGEALGWATGLATLALAVAAHAVAVGHVVHADDPVSPGWAGMLGPGFFVRAVVLATPLELVPIALAAPVMMLGALGWTAWRHPTAHRVLAVLGAYAVLISVFCRADTFYWGVLVAPLFLPGLVFVPDAVHDLWTAAIDRRRIVVRRLPR